MIQFRKRIAGRGPRNFDLLVLLRIVNLDEEHEAVQLRLGQRVGSLLLDRVLRGQHQKRRRQRQRLSENRDLAFLHRFEHRRLSLRRRTIDFVGQHDVGEHRPGDELETASPVAVALQNVRAGDVHRHQVGRELDAAEFQRHRLGHFTDQQSFRQSGNAHQQGVPSRKKADRQLLDYRMLADDHPAKLAAEPGVGLAHPIDRLNVIFSKLSFFLKLLFLHRHGIRHVVISRE